MLSVISSSSTRHSIEGLLQRHLAPPLAVEEFRALSVSWFCARLAHGRKFLPQFWVRTSEERIPSVIIRIVLEKQQLLFCCLKKSSRLSQKWVDLCTVFWVFVLTNCRFWSIGQDTQSEKERKLSLDFMTFQKSTFLFTSSNVDFQGSWGEPLPLSAAAES